MFPLQTPVVLVFFLNYKYICTGMCVCGGGGGGGGCICVCLQRLKWEYSCFKLVLYESKIETLG